MTSLRYTFFPAKCLLYQGNWILAVPSCQCCLRLHSLVTSWLHTHYTFLPAKLTWLIQFHANIIYSCVHRAKLTSRSIVHSWEKLGDGVSISHTVGPTCQCLLPVYVIAQHVNVREIWDAAISVLVSATAILSNSAVNRAPHRYISCTLGTRYIGAMTRLSFLMTLHTSFSYTFVVYEDFIGPATAIAYSLEVNGRSWLPLFGCMCCTQFYIGYYSIRQFCHSWYTVSNYLQYWPYRVNIASNCKNGDYVWPSHQITAVAINIVSVSDDWCDGHTSFLTVYYILQHMALTMMRWYMIKQLCNILKLLVHFMILQHNSLQEL